MTRSSAIDRDTQTVAVSIRRSAAKGSMGMLPEAEEMSQRPTLSVLSKFDRFFQGLDKKFDVPTLLVFDCDNPSRQFQMVRQKNEFPLRCLIPIADVPHKGSGPGVDLACFSRTIDFIHPPRMPSRSENRTGGVIAAVAASSRHVSENSHINLPERGFSWSERE